MAKRTRRLAPSIFALGLLLRDEPESPKGGRGKRVFSMWRSIEGTAVPCRHQCESKQRPARRASSTLALGLFFLQRLGDHCLQRLLGGLDDGLGAGGLYEDRALFAADDRP